jgi:hypothetical protein
MPLSRMGRATSKPCWISFISSTAAPAIHIRRGPVKFLGQQQRRSWTNVIPTGLDVFAPERWVDDALFRPESRDAFARLLARGRIEATRRMHPEEYIYAPERDSRPTRLIKIEIRAPLCLSSEKEDSHRSSFDGSPAQATIASKREINGGLAGR